MPPDAIELKIGMPVVYDGDVYIVIGFDRKHNSHGLSATVTLQDPIVAQSIADDVEKKRAVMDAVIRAHGNES